MAKKKLPDDIKAHPGRLYRLPGDIVRVSGNSGDWAIEAARRGAGTGAV
jgi:hypothetical protein